MALCKMNSLFTVDKDSYKGSAELIDGIWRPQVLLSFCALKEAAHIDVQTRAQRTCQMQCM